jgi:hypothetical protein
MVQIGWFLVEICYGGFPPIMLLLLYKVKYWSNMIFKNRRSKSPPKITQFVPNQKQWSMWMSSVLLQSFDNVSIYQKLFFSWMIIDNFHPKNLIWKTSFVDQIVTRLCSNTDNIHMDHCIRFEVHWMIFGGDLLRRLSQHNVTFLV